MKKVLFLLLIIPFIYGCATMQKEDSEEITISSDGGGVIRLKKAADLQTGLFRFAGDGDYLFFMENHSIGGASFPVGRRLKQDTLLRCSLKTGKVEQMVSAANLNGNRIDKYSVSADGRFAAVSVSNQGIFSGLYLVNIEKGTMTELAAGRGSEPSFLFFSPENNNLITVIAKNRLKVWKTDEERLIADTPVNPGYGIFKTSETGGYFAIITDNTSGQIVNSETLGIVCNIAEQSEILESWDPKSVVIDEAAGFVAFSGSRKNSLKKNIYIRYFDFDDKELKLLKQSSKKDFILQSSYNGKFLIAIDENGEWELVTTETGKAYLPGTKISGILLSDRSNTAVTVDLKGKTVNRIDLEHPETGGSEIVFKTEIRKAALFDGDSGLVALTNDEIILYDMISNMIVKSLSVNNAQYAVDSNTNLFCYATENGFSVLDSVFKVKLADYYFLNGNDYIIKTKGNEFILSESLQDNKDLIPDGVEYNVGASVDLTRPIFPPVISIKDIYLSKPFLKAGEEAELEISVINSGPGDAARLKLELEAGEGLIISGEDSFDLVKSNGGMQKLELRVKADSAAIAGKTSLSVRVYEEDFGIRIRGKKLEFQILEAAKPEVILAKYFAEEYNSESRNNIIDINEVIDVTFYLQNIGRADTGAAEYSIECRQQGVKAMGYVGTDGEISDKPGIKTIASGDYVGLKQRFFINSNFREDELKFLVEYSDKGGSALQETAAIPVNRRISEQGQIRTIRSVLPETPASVKIRNIEEPEEITASTSPNEAPYLTVLDFNSAAETGGESRLITSLIAETVVKSGLYRLVDREEREQIFEELNFSLSALSVEENTLEVGRMVSANYMISGTVDRMQDSYLVTMKLIKTETGEMISSGQSIIRSFEEITEVIPQETLELINY